ncbi:large ribosomal subunit protein mL46-like [Ornithodoros turicata]|uniref:large ribosomal subunit protein mL46-like n=1 Tax=Ornithodoros turicata TaxID=34597 RepID=UPI0031393D33
MAAATVRRFSFRSLLLLRIHSHTTSGKNAPGICQMRYNSTKWQLVGALAVERKPIITKDMNPLELRYLEMLRQIEVEASLLSDHELQLKEEERTKEKSTGESMQLKLKTARDLVDQWIAELKSFKSDSRVTDSDKSGDVRTTDRKLDTSLLFVTHQKLGKEFQWVLPQTPHRDGETLRETAERALAEICGSDGIDIKALGNAPAGFYKYLYPKDMRKDFLGAKVFFFKAQLQSDRSLTQKGIQKLGLADDFAWLSSSELASRLQPRYVRSVRQFLMEAEAPNVKRLLEDVDGALQHSSATRSERQEEARVRQSAKN